MIENEEVVEWCIQRKIRSSTYFESIVALHDRGYELVSNIAAENIVKAGEINVAIVNAINHTSNIAWHEAQHVMHSYLAPVDISVDPALSTQHGHRAHSSANVPLRSTPAHEF